MVVCASNAALHNREISFNGVRLCSTANVFARAVVNGLMLVEVAADNIATRPSSVITAVLPSICALEDGPQRLCGD